MIQHRDNILIAVALNFMKQQWREDAETARAAGLDRIAQHMARNAQRADELTDLLMFGDIHLEVTDHG